MNKSKKDNIFLLLFDAFTIVIWIWMVTSFFSKGAFDLPEYIATLYLLLLAFYVGDKEVRRIRKKYRSRLRRGEYFVYLWGMTLVGIVGFYIWGGSAHGYAIPTQLPTIAGSVLVLYILTEYLKGGKGDVKV